MRFEIDMFAVMRGVLIASGFSEAGVPSLFYDGVSVPIISMYIPRPDLIDHHGSAASNWGFRFTALFSEASIVHGKLTLVFTDGTRIDNPGLHMQTRCDYEYSEIIERFKSETQRGGRILEIGSRARSGNTYRNWFPETIDYVGLDITAGPNVDVIGDAHHLSRHVSGEFDFIFSVSVFEHILMPWLVALEMSKVLKLGGLAYIQSHAAFPLHEEPWDFWRYSKDAWKGLFNKHTGFEIISAGYAVQSWTIPNYACGGSTDGMDFARNYLLSCCLVRKVGDRMVSWDAEAADVYDLNYTHA